MTASYVNSDLELCSRILNTGEVDERKTADVLRRVASKVVEEYGFDIANITIVTDNAANIWLLSFVIGVAVCLALQIV